MKSYGGKAPTTVPGERGGTVEPVGPATQLDTGADVGRPRARAGLFGKVPLPAGTSDDGERPATFVTPDAD